MAGLNLIAESLRRQRGLYLLWIFSLAAAVSGLMIVDVYRQSLTGTLRAQGRKILTADVAVSARRLLNADEERQLKESVPRASMARLTEMFAMVSTARASRLALVRFISDDYPLVGELRLERTPVTGMELKEGSRAWADADLLALLKVKSGDKIKIGQSEFVLDKTLGKDSSQTFRFGNMAPRIYLHRRHLDATGLVQYGSTLSDTLFAITRAPVGLKEKLEKTFKDPGVQITVPADLEQGSLRILSRLLDFLGLTGLVTLSLGWIGVYYLGRRWLSLEAKSAGVLKCLGFSSTELYRLLMVKLCLILLSGVVAGGIFAWLAAKALFPLVKDSLPADFSILWSWSSTVLILAVGPIAGILLLRRAVKRLAFEKPLDLFQERSQGSSPDLRGIFMLLASVATLFLALTFLQARSWKVTGTFVTALSVSVLIIAGFAYASLKFIARARRENWPWRVHLFTAQWTRRPGTSVLLITVSALAGLLSQLLPHLEKTLVSELQSPKVFDRPALFMVDIQDEQLEPLKDFLQQKQIEITKYAPFVRARIVSVNGQEFERAGANTLATREEENDARFRNRGVNLSYRQELSPSEKIVAGKAWKDLGVSPPEVAVEEGYAERLKLALGDSLVFDVQGMEIEARIASLRKIEWESFNPNFFIQFPDGVLNEAPKTWIMAVRKNALYSVPEMQTLITEKFPNVTSININEALDNITELLQRLSGGLKMASRLSLGLGIFVFLMILLFQLVSARPDWRQLMVLGLTGREVWRLQVVSYGWLCLTGTAMGAGLSFVVAWALFRFAFASRAEFDYAGMAEVWLITWGSALLGLAWLGWRETRAAGCEISGEFRSL